MEADGDVGVGVGGEPPSPPRPPPPFLLPRRPGGCTCPDGRDVDGEGLEWALGLRSTESIAGVMGVGWCPRHSVGRGALDRWTFDQAMGVLERRARWGSRTVREAAMRMRWESGAGDEHRTLSSAGGNCGGGPSTPREEETKNSGDGRKVAPAGRGSVDISDDEEGSDALATLESALGRRSAAGLDHVLRGRKVDMWTRVASVGTLPEKVKAKRGRPPKKRRGPAQKTIQEAGARMEKRREGAGVNAVDLGKAYVDGSRQFPHLVGESSESHGWEREILNLDAEEFGILNPRDGTLLGPGRIGRGSENEDQIFPHFRDKEEVAWMKACSWSALR